MQVSSDEFLRQAVACGLLPSDDAARLVKSSANAASATTAAALAEELVRSGRMTSFQAAVLLAGKGDGLVLGNYLVQDRLGQGGMGVVYRAVHQRMGRVVALKVVSPHASQTSDLFARFRREIQAAAKLVHPNIVTAFDADRAGDVLYLVLEFVDGTDLGALLKKDGPLPLDRAVGYAIQAARGLEYAHGRGVVHRDVKPSNLLLDRAGVVKVLDMGLARLTVDGNDEAASQTDLTGTGVVMGTVDYMSPEQALDTRHADAQSDVYSLGCALFTLATGRPVFEGNTVVKKILAHREVPIPSLAATLKIPADGTPRATLAAAVDAVLRGMLAKRPQDRIADMTIVIAALEECLARAAAASAASSRPPRSTPPVARVVGVIGETYPTVSSNTPAVASADAAWQFGSTPGATPPDATIADRPRVHSTPRSGRSLPGWLIPAGGAIALAGVLALVVALSGGVGQQTTKSPTATQASTNASNHAGTETSRGIEDDEDNGGDPVKPNRAAAKPKPAYVYDDRIAAEAMLRSRGRGRVIIKAGDNPPRDVTEIRQLPSGTFQLLFVQIVGTAFVSRGDLAKLNGAPHLTRLEVNGAAISDFQLEGLTDLPALKQLQLTNVPVSDEALKTVGRFETLEVLVLNCETVSDDGVDHLLGLARLTGIDLQGSRVTAAGMRKLTVLKNLDWILVPHGANADLGILREFPLLNDLGLHQATDDELAVVAELPRLETLRLSQGFTDKGLLEHVARCQGLKTLLLYHGNLTRAGVEELKKRLPDCKIEADETCFTPAEESGTGLR